MKIFSINRLAAGVGAMGGVRNLRNASNHPLVFERPP
jgi:hypothetical protein